MKQVEEGSNARYIKSQYEKSETLNLTTIKLIKGIEKQITNFLDKGFNKQDLKKEKLYKTIPEKLKSNFESMLEEIIGNTKANADGLTNSILYFETRDNSKNREGSAEHILTDHIDQINVEFITQFKRAIKNNHFEKVAINSNLDRYSTMYEFKNDKGKVRYFFIVADKNEKNDLRIVTAFIKSRIKKK